MPAQLHTEFGNTRLTLLPAKAIWWEEQQALLLSDLHLGKVSHFRKNGLALSPQAVGDELPRLAQLIETYQPKTTFLLGDLFHSDLNSEWELLRDFIRKHSTIEFSLVPGNHDILEAGDYKKAGIQVLDPVVQVGGLTLVHDLSTIHPQAGKFYVQGHLHPGFRVVGKGRQSLRLPAFYKSEQLLTLPAFGKLTGLHLPRWKNKHEVFVVTPNGVEAIHQRA